MRIKVISIAVFFAALASSASSQTKTATVGGFVYHRGSGETLIGATVALSGEGVMTGAFTNNNGYFVISNAPVGIDTTNVSYVGYKSTDTANTIRLEITR